MFYVYVIRNTKKTLYIGTTTDLRRRLREHNEGKSKYTSEYDNWDLVYYEAYKSKIDANDRERKLKQFGSSYGKLKKRISNSLQ